MAQEVIVQKYGGESVADRERMEKVAEHIVNVAKAGKKVVVVISAMGKTTDELIQLAKQFYGGPPPKDKRDYVLVTGEQLAAGLLALKCTALGIEAIPLTGWQIGLEADSNGMVKMVAKREFLRQLLIEGKFSVLVVAGSQGIIEGTDRVVTLGRGGSDATAVALAVALGLPECELYKDVPGVFTIDPDIVPDARRFKTIPYGQMARLAEAGAKVIMPRAVALAQNFGVKIRVLLSPSIGESTGGTLVYSGASLEEMEKGWFQPAIAIREKVALFGISNVSNQPGAAAAIFHPLKDINIIDSTQVMGGMTTDINILCWEEDRSSVSAELKIVKEKGMAGEIMISEHPNLVQLSVVSPPMVEVSGYWARIVEALAGAQVNNEAHGSAGSNIWVMVKEKCLREAAIALAEEFDLLEKGVV